jgi:hypothetical protein
LQEKRVLIVEPNEQLNEQTACKVVTVDDAISIISINRLYQEGAKYDVVILNEYDQIVNDHSFGIYNNVIKGLWIFREVKVFAFSATSSASYERFIGNCIVKPKVLTFKSEYEQVHGKSPIVEPKLVTAADEKQLISLIEEDIVKIYEKQPIIIILEDN